MSGSNRKGHQRLILLLAFLIMAVVGYSQVNINSPYSRFGMGELAPRKSTYNFSMGGIANAISSPQHVNPYNPAANAGLDTLSFVFDGGIVSMFGNVTSDELSRKTNFATLGYLLFGFPISKRIKASVGLTPYSNVGYKVVDDEIVENIGRTGFYFEGTGGANEFFLGTSLLIHKNLSVGLRTSYMFGKSVRASAVFFPDSIGLINTRVDNHVDVGDLYFDFGFQYQKLLNNGMTLGVGGIFAPSQNISAERKYLVRSFFSTAIGIESFRDTIDYDFRRGDIVIPEKYGLGIMLKNKQKWMIGADVDWQNWSKFKAFGVQDSLVNDFQVSVGGEYFPSDRSIDGYWKKVKYRAGFRYHETYLFLRDTHIKDFGISFGFGFPLPRSLTTLNLGIEIGKYGTTENNLYQNNYIKINLGVSVWERWFVKRKYY